MAEHLLEDDLGHGGGAGRHRRDGRLQPLGPELLPLGVAQLYESVDKGYWEARELEFLTNDTNALLEWLRLPGDIVFIGGGALPVLYITYVGDEAAAAKTTS